MNLSSSIKLVVILLTGVLVSGLLFFILVNPAMSNLKQLNERVREKKTEAVTLEQQIRAFNNAQSDLSKATRKEEILNAFLIKEDLVAAVKSIEAGALVSQTFEELKITEEVEEPGKKSAKDEVLPVIENKKDLEEIPYRITTGNDFAGTVQFLQYLEHLPQFTEISKINLSAVTLEDEVTGERIYTGQVFGSIDGVFFIRPQEQQE